MASFMALAGFGSKKRKKDSGEIETVEIKLDLFQPTADKFPRFHLPTLIKEQTGRSFDDENPLEDNEEFRKLESIASKFEEKYGPKKKDKKCRKKYKFGKPEDYMDLGMGYDLEDPFIDDTEGYDELVPSTLTPIHGGFYVNRGPLEFKEVSESDEDDEEKSTDGESKTKTNRLSVVSNSRSTSGESSKSDDGASDGSDLDVTHKNGALPNEAGPLPRINQSAPVPGDRLKGRMVQARPSMTPKQKASASLLKTSKGWVRKNMTGHSDRKRTVQADERSSSFYARVDDAVNSVLASMTTMNKTLPVDNKSPDPSRTEDQFQKIFSAVVKVNRAKEQRTETGPSLWKTVLETKDGESRVKAPTPQSKDLKSSKPVDPKSPEVTVVKEVSSKLQRSPRLTGKPPTAMHKTSETTPKWQVPLHFQKLNEILVERAKEQGQLCFCGRTDVVLRKIMTDCVTSGFDEEKTDAVLSDLSMRLRVSKPKILARWEKVKARPPTVKTEDGSTSASTTPVSTSTSSSAATASKTPPSAVTATKTTPTSAVAMKKPADTTPTSMKKASDTNLANSPVATLQKLLEEEIKRQMPGLESEHRKMAEDVALKKLELINSGSASADITNQKNMYTPRRKYGWNDLSRKLLNAIVEKILRLIAVDSAFPDKEEALRKYFEMHVVQLWPSGWMNARELMKETRDIQHQLIRSKETTVPLSNVTQSSPKAVSTASTSSGQSNKPAPGTSTFASSQASAKTSTQSTAKNAVASTAPKPTPSSPPKAAGPVSVQSTKPVATSTPTHPSSNNYRTPTTTNASSAAVAASAVKVGSSMSRPQVISKTSPLLPPPRLGFSIQNLTSPAATSANSSSTTPSPLARTWNSDTQRMQMELELMMARARQAQPNHQSSDSWFQPPRNQ